MKKHIPNFITCLNLFSGCIGIVFAFNGELKTAAYFVVLSAVFDFFDGMVARLLKANSPIGKDLDSLADMVSFGFLPGVVMYQLLTYSLVGSTTYAFANYVPYLGFIITIFSALRLAKFNVDSRQSVDFIGLNTPMNTLFIISLPFIQDNYPQIINSTSLLLTTTLITSYLLIGEFRLFSLKLGSTSWKENKFRYLFILLSALSLVFLHFAAIPIILFLYISLSFLHFNKTA